MRKLLIAVILLLLSHDCFAAASISDTPQWANGVSQSYSYTVGSNSNRLLVAKLLWYGGTDRNVSSCTYNGTTLVKAIGSHYNIGGYFLTVEIWYIFSPSSGSNTFTWSLDGAVDGYNSSIQSGDGFLQSGPDATISYQENGTASPTSHSITTVADQAFIFDAIINGGGWSGTIAAVSPQVDGASTYSSYKGPVSAGSNTMGWTYTGTSQASHAIASFAPAPDVINTTKIYNTKLYNTKIYG